jgi:hypothetical protein
MQLRALLVVLIVAGCRGDRARPPAVDPAYREDVERICEVERLAGVADRPDENPQVVTALWLDGNLQTAEARDFLAAIALLAPADKAARLRGEAQRAGLAGCAVAGRWEE